MARNPPDRPRYRSEPSGPPIRRRRRPTGTRNPSREDPLGKARRKGPEVPNSEEVLQRLHRFPPQGRKEQELIFLRQTKRPASAGLFLCESLQTIAGQGRLRKERRTVMEPQQLDFVRKGKGPDRDRRVETALFGTPIPDPPSRVRADVTEKELSEAIRRQSRTSYEQCQKAGLI